MKNLEWLKSLKEIDEKINLDELISKAQSEECPASADIQKFKFEYRKMKALEIIAETLINIDDKLDSLINNGKAINVDTHEV